MTNERKPRGRPASDTEPVMVRLHRSLIGAIDAYRRKQDDMPSRPEVIRRAVTEWLNQKDETK